MGTIKFSDAGPEFMVGMATVQKQKSKNHVRWRVVLTKPSSNPVVWYLSKQQCYDLADALDQLLDFQEGREDAGLERLDESE